MDKSKEKRIYEEMSRIIVFFAESADNLKAVIFPLIQNVCFMKVTLEDLQETINEEGATEVYQNGENQRGIKQSAALQSYNALVKNYTSAVKTLSSYLPSSHRQIEFGSYRSLDEKKKKEDELKATLREEMVREAERWARNAGVPLDDEADQSAFLPPIGQPAQQEEEPPEEKKETYSVQTFEEWQQEQLERKRQQEEKEK